MELFKLLGTIMVDNSKANQSIDDTTDKAKESGEVIQDTADKAERSGSRWGNALSKVGSAAVKCGQVVASGLAAGAAALGALTVKALSAAGDLEQNMGGSEAVFKDHAKKMQDAAGEAYKNMGLSASDFLGTANKMGALFQGAGFGIEESATMSADAMQRAADVASIMGIDTASAMEAIAGAAKGNFTMMDNLGVAMNDTTLNAYAMSKGIDKTTQDMTNQEKIGLAMEMFMEKTAYAAGNYAKENETLAGSLGTAKAAMQNFLSGAGTADQVVSSFTNAGKVIVKNIQSLFPGLVTGLIEIVNQLLPMIPPMLEQLLPGLISGAQSLLNGLVALLPSLISMLTTSALPPLLTGIVSVINAIISALPSVVQAICAALPTLLPQLITGLVSVIVTLCSNFAQIIQPIIDYLPQIIVAVVTALVQNLPTLLMGVGQLIMGIVRAIPQLLSALWQAITTLASNFAKTLFGKIGQWIRQLFPKSADNIFKVLATIKDGFTVWINTIKAIFSVVVSIISRPFKIAWEGIKLVWNNVVAYFKMIWENIKTIFSVVDSVLSGDFKGAWEGIKKIFSNVGGFFLQVVRNVGKAFANVWKIITDPFRKARDGVKKIVDSIKGFFTNLKLRFPKIPLPHFSITPSGWKVGDLLKGVKPKLGIEWYAKAMNNPMVMTQPTVFGYNPHTGKLMGGGERGSEVVAGTNSLMGMISAAVAEQNSATVYYLQKLVNILVGFCPQVLEAMERDIVLDSGEMVAALAVPMDRELGRIQARKERGR